MQIDGSRRRTRGKRGSTRQVSTASSKSRQQARFYEEREHWSKLDAMGQQYRSRADLQAIEAAFHGPLAQPARPPVIVNPHPLPWES